MLSLALLTVPGLALYSRIAKEFTLAELCAASIALSIALLPFAAIISVPLGIHPAIPLAVLAVALLMRKGGKLRSVEPAALISSLFFGVLVLAVLSQYFVGGVVHITQAGDTAWHISNAQWFSISPHLPPEDAYSPGHYIGANWFATVLLGFADFRLAFALAAIALFLSVYLAGEKLFKSGLAAGWLYMSLAGASWALGGETFAALIFSPLGFKFDPTLLFFFLPQPQALGLMLLAFALFLFLEKRHALLGVTLAALLGYHLQTGCVLLFGLLVYYLAKREVPHFMPWFAALALPALLPLFSISGGQIALALQPAALPTAALTLLPLAVLAWPKRRTEFLPLLAVLCYAFALLIAIPLTNNGYRFLAYAALPTAILASPALRKPAVALIAALLCVSSLTLVAFYVGNSYSQAAPSELAGLEWAKQNTPRDAVFLEKYSLFPRVPLLAQRRVLYAGYFGPQYHGYDGREAVESITRERNPALLRQKLLDAGVDYVFLGEREKALPFAEALAQFEQPYPGIIRVS